ncbi:hypothetical protein ANCCAN_20795 [Ancylostoma caninum]|uniref:DUF5641 domain-containing protein n=1 Tax=Ancylostoma caninum TaxID=29170 RepID=A0A368FMK5_ANCCA|nr:hypothetical protein ANCCAN_20795 [Ancylostoma caninum]
MNEERAEDLLDYCATNKVQFKFISAFSPWQGVHEQMIGIFKSAFTQVTRNRTLLMDDLHTLAKESEAICNSRPLTYVNDQEEFLPLRPVDFMRPTARLSFSRLLNEDEEWRPHYTTRVDLIKDWRFGLQLLESFWNRWQVEYPTSLRERHQISHPYPWIHHYDKPANGDSNSTAFTTDNINLVSGFEITPNATTQEQTATQNESTERSTRSSTHLMVTRSKARQQQLNLPLFISIMTALLQCVVSASFRYPEELTLDKKIIYAKPCVTNGVAVAVHSKKDKKQISWFPVTCPHGETQASFHPSKDLQLCGRKCECPKWSQFCSHYSNSRTQQSKASNIPSEFLHFTPDKICSFEQSTKCSQRKKIGTFNQIELYDGTLLLVSRLPVSVKDYPNSDDFICIDSEGKIVAATRSYQRTSMFCEKQQCSDSTNNFSMYALYDFSNTRS